MTRHETILAGRLSVSTLFDRGVFHKHNGREASILQHNTGLSLDIVVYLDLVWFGDSADEDMNRGDPPIMSISQLVIIVLNKRKTVTTHGDTASFIYKLGLMQNIKGIVPVNHNTMIRPHYLLFSTMICGHASQQTARCFGLRTSAGTAFYYRQTTIRTGTGSAAAHDYKWLASGSR